MKAGQIVTYGGATYVITTEKELNKYYFGTPDDPDFAYLFVKFNPSETPKTSKDYPEGKIENPQPGLLYKDDDGKVFVRVYGADWGTTPEHDLSANWVQVDL